MTATYPGYGCRMLNSEWNSARSAACSRRLTSFCRRGARVFVGSGAVFSQLYVEDDREKSPTQEELETLLRSAGVGAGAATVGTGESRSTCLSLEFCVLFMWTQVDFVLAGNSYCSLVA